MKKIALSLTAIFIAVIMSVLVSCASHEVNNSNGVSTSGTDNNGNSSETESSMPDSGEEISTDRESSGNSQETESSAPDSGEEISTDKENSGNS